MASRPSKGQGWESYLSTPTGKIVRQAIKCIFITNNAVEYKFVTADLELAKLL